MKSMKKIKQTGPRTVLAVTLMFQTAITNSAENLPTLTKMTTGPVVTDTAGAAGFAWLDADNDKFLDLYVANLSVDPNSHKVLDSFYMNKGDGTFAKITTNAIAAIPAAPSWAWWPTTMTTMATRICSWPTRADSAMICTATKGRDY